VHFDSAGSEETSATSIREFSEDDVLARQARDVARNQERDPEDARAHALDGRGDRALDEIRARTIDNEDQEDDAEEEEASEPPLQVREGLPARFRMRHTPHYVDELLGDAPLRTVREIPVSEIESPSDDRAELEDLERSIRRLGVIEPLLVGRRGAFYRVIAGMRRLRAAQRVGLDTVPCLVHDVDEERLTDMRDAAMQRLAVPQPPREPEAVEIAPPITPPTLAEAAPGLEFVAALLPAMNAAGNDRMRWSVLTDLAGVEISRTKALAAAHEIVKGGTTIDRASVDYLALVSGVVSGVAIDARLRGVRVELSAPDSDCDIFLDGARCRDALTGLLQSLLTLAPRGGSVLSVDAQITSIRPALIVVCRLHDCDPEPGPGALARFFDAGWREHPAGAHGALLLGALAHTARAHGGRVDAKALAKGCQVTFVVPRLDG
jgi:ParB/Sulfiredoxin domain